MTPTDFWIIWLCGVLAGLGLSAILYALGSLVSIYVDQRPRGYRG